jgi:hypothetical protein
MNVPHSMLEHINKVKLMAQQLEAIWAKVEKIDFVMVFLCNLHESYNNLIIT